MPTISLRLSPAELARLDHVVCVCDQDSRGHALRSLLAGTINPPPPSLAEATALARAAGTRRSRKLTLNVPSLGGRTA